MKNKVKMGLAALALLLGTGVEAAESVYPTRFTNLSAALSTGVYATAWLPLNQTRAGVKVVNDGAVWACPIRSTTTVSGSNITYSAAIPGLNATNQAAATGFLIVSNWSTGGVWIPVEQMGVDEYQLRSADTNSPTVKTIEFSKVK